ncbi:MAG: SpoIIE family protein phosphatase [Desulfobacterales bacterium]
MRFRWKLLILLLCLSILPIVLLRTFGIHNVRRIGAELAEQARQNAVDLSRLRTQELLGMHGSLLHQIVAQLEMAMVLQAHATRTFSFKHASDIDPSLPEPSPFPPESVGPVRISALGFPGDCLISMSPSGTGPGTGQLQELNSMMETYRVISGHLGALVLRQMAWLPGGIGVSHPCPAGSWDPVDAESSTWFRTAMDEKISYWSRPYVDAATGDMAIALSYPITHDPDSDEGIVRGVAGLIVSLESLFHAVVDESTLPQGADAFIGSLEWRPSAGEVGIRVVAGLPPGKPASAGETFVDRSWFRQQTQYPEVLEDFLLQRPNVRSVNTGSGDFFWICHPLPHQGTALILTLPRSGASDPVDAMIASIGRRTRTVEIYTAVFLLFLAAIGAVAAVLFSRAITRPLEKITRAAQDLADGNLKTRVEVTSKDEIAKLADVINDIGPKLEQAYQTRRSIEVASEIQSHLLPDPLPSVDFDVFGLTLYSEMAGGDYFDYLCNKPLDRQLCVVIGDVSGHGLSSALLMASVRSAIRMRSLTPGRLNEIVESVNRVFAQDVVKSGNFMTLLLVRLNAEAGEMHWVRAGHDPGMLYDSYSDTFHTMDGRGIPLGVAEDAEFEERSVSIRKGQILFLGTDGIWETRNEDGEIFGKERVNHLIREHAGATAKDIALAVINAVEEFRASDKEDDMTCVVVKVT